MRTLLRSPDLETTRSYGSMIHDSGRMLLWTLDRVIFTNTMANDEALDRDGLIDVEGLCERLQETFRDRAPAAVPIDVQITEGAQQITGDEDGLRRALEELLDNALKHTSKDGHIELAFTVEGSTRVRISVTDDGPGIPTDEVSRLLLPFQQRETSYTRQEGGAGEAFISSAASSRRTRAISRSGMRRAAAPSSRSPCRATPPRNGNALSRRRRPRPPGPSPRNVPGPCAPAAYSRFRKAAAPRTK